MHKKIKTFLMFILSVTFVFVFSACGSNSTAENSINNMYEYSDMSDKESNDTTANQNTIDPFDGLEVQFDGISPYCKISFNNSKCSADVQNNVVYSVSKDDITTSGNFKKNEDVTVYAFLSPQSQLKDGKKVTYHLSNTEKTYTVKDVPEYITEITNDMNFDEFESELKDYYDSITAWKQADYCVFGTPSGYFVSSSDKKTYDTYFSCLKPNKYDAFSDKVCFNKINIMYSVKIANTSYDSYSTFDPTPGKYYTQYFTIYAENVIRYPDGKIGWGKKDPASLEFDYSINGNSLNDLTNDEITSKKDSYNVKKVEAINVEI